MGSGSTAALFCSPARSGPTSSITLCRPAAPRGRAGPGRHPRVFLTAEPDLEVAVVQRLVVDDRVISHLRLTVHRQPADFIATDILRVIAMGGSRTTGIWKTISHSANRSA
jgi:hypothetical protein